MRAEPRRGEGGRARLEGPVRRFVARSAAVLALTLTAGACTPFDDLMVFMFGRSMRDQPSFDPYENPRPPAEGSVPFAAGNYPAQLSEVNVGQAAVVPYDLPSFTAADMARGGEVAAALVNPVPATEESLARGQIMYDRFCAVCHGPAGESAEAPIIEKLPAMAAFNLTGPRAVTYTDGYIYGMIRVGRGLMPEYGHRIPHFDRWHIVNYVRRLQAGAGGAGAADAQAPAPAADTAGGGR